MKQPFFLSQTPGLQCGFALCFVRYSCWYSLSASKPQKLWKNLKNLKNDSCLGGPCSSRISFTGHRLASQVSVTCATCATCATWILKKKVLFSSVFYKLSTFRVIAAQLALPTTPAPTSRSASAGLAARPRWRLPSLSSLLRVLEPSSARNDLRNLRIELD